MTTAGNSGNRSEADTIGMSQLHAGRPPEQMIKELLQNAFDEDVSTCTVRILLEPEGVLITVHDDGPGFDHIQDAYTLMGETPKRGNPEKRGTI